MEEIDRDSDEFLVTLLAEVPEDCYWKISGLDGTSSEQLLKPYFAEDSECGHSWHCIMLTKEVRAEVINKLWNENVAAFITHMEFWVGGKVWLRSYDNMMHNYYYVDFISEEFREYCRRWNWAILTGKDG